MSSVHNLLTSVFLCIGYLWPTLSVKWCETPNECGGDTIHDTVHSFGYESLYGPGTDVIVPGLSTGTSRYLDCQGSRSCAEMDSITWTDAGDAQFTCFGSMSCAGIKLVETEATLYSEHQPFSRCWGSNACANSNWKNTKRSDKAPSFGCEADRSCADSNFYGFASIVGWGSWSLEGAQIESFGDLYAEFHGYRSGYNATVICNAGDACHIKCWGSACTGTQIICHGTCDKEYVTNHNQDIPSVDTNLVNSGEITVAMNNLCDRTKSSSDLIVATDKFPPSINGDGVALSSSQPLCCRAAWSCENSNIYIEGEDVRDVPIVCSGRSSCAGSIITNTNGDIYCDGGAGCERSVITTDRSVYCMGIWGCSFDATVYAKNVYCTGYGSCWDVDIHSNGELNVYITASGMHDLSIYCNDEDTCNIYCTWNPSYGQCGVVYCNGDCNVQCEGDWGCPPIYYKDLCYYVAGNAATISGDPHVTTWSGIRHSYQGQPTLNGLDQYYYMYPCHGSDHTDLPFHLLGKHVALANNEKLSGLDYVVLELFDDDDIGYVVFLAPTIHEYAQMIDNEDNTVYDNDNSAQERQVLVSGQSVFIGNRFEILYEQQDAKSMAVTLTIDGECSMLIEMIGQFRVNPNSGRYTMSYLRANPPNCYKCAICGLFGDFQGWSMQTCDGQGTVDYGGFKNAWDERAWTWERTYVEENCPPTKIYTTDVPGTTKTPYVPMPDPTFAYDPCQDLDSDERNASTAQCQSVMDDKQIRTCCNEIGGEYCNHLLDDCMLDACENSQLPTVELSDAVQQLFTDPILRECGNLTYIPDNYKIYATESPSAMPTSEPTDTQHPTHRNSPTFLPTVTPITTMEPTQIPTRAPTFAPIAIPTMQPTDFPTAAPTQSPTDYPSRSPIAGPTRAPTPAPSPLPTEWPTMKPTLRPTSASPTATPTLTPSRSPTDFPSIPPTTASPTTQPTAIPSANPSQTPSGMPTRSPSQTPTRTVSHCCKDQETETMCVSHSGTSCVWLVANSPLAIKYNTRCLSQSFVKMKITGGSSHNSHGGGHEQASHHHSSPTSKPTAKQSPTHKPTSKPTAKPSWPTAKPTAKPTDDPTTAVPTTVTPTTSTPTTYEPTVASGHPSAAPTTIRPTQSPSTALPSASPTTTQPTSQSPTTTAFPTAYPTTHAPSSDGSEGEDGSSNGGGDEHESCHPVEQMMPFMLVVEDESDSVNVIVDEAVPLSESLFARSEIEIAILLSILTVFIICGFSSYCRNDKEENLYEVIDDPSTIKTTTKWTTYSVI